MTNLTLLQSRINELNCAIINFVENKVYLTGFYSEKMMRLHLDEARDNHHSKGIYDKEEINFNKVLNNSLFIIQENGIEQKRIQYQQVFKDILKLKNSNKKLMVSIRKNTFSNQFILITEKYEYSFENHIELNHYLLEQYQTDLNFGEEWEYGNSSN